MQKQEEEGVKEELFSNCKKRRGALTGKQGDVWTGESCEFNSVLVFLRSTPLRTEPLIKLALDSLEFTKIVGSIPRHR